MFNLKWAITFDQTIAKSKLRNRSMARLREAARYFKERIEANAPVDSGRLRDSVKLIPRSDGDGIDLFCDVEYAVFVEFGFIHYLSGQWIPPNPFIRKSAIETQQKYPFLRFFVKPMGRPN